MTDKELLQAAMEIKADMDARFSANDPAMRIGKITTNARRLSVHIIAQLQCEECGGSGNVALSREPFSTAITDCRSCGGTGIGNKENQ